MRPASSTRVEPSEHRVLDLGVADHAARPDGAEGPDEAVDHFCPRPDDGRATDVAADETGTCLDDDPPVELAFGVDLPVDAPFDRLPGAGGWPPATA